MPTPNPQTGEENDPSQVKQAVDNAKEKLDIAKERVEHSGLFQKMRQAWVEHVEKNKKKGAEGAARAVRAEGIRGYET